ncbi:MAG TPA: hypothetical protein VE977_11525 [Pyrinomonadaceae bacterium]|nr:hypothetical protein [Pyrinomonadaceae bacterium]
MDAWPQAGQRKRKDRDSTFRIDLSRTFSFGTLAVYRNYEWGLGIQPSNEPAEQAERVLAPGDGEAEPGVTATNFQEPAKLATDSSLGGPSAHFVGQEVSGAVSPGWASPSAWG